MIHAFFINVRKSQEDEIGMFIANKNWECGLGLRLKPKGLNKIT
jgi:hypothetical protein